MKATAFYFILAAACGTVAACDHQASVAEDVTVQSTITPARPVVGAATLARISLRDAAGRPVRGAKLQVEGNMLHPGMAPIITKAAERDDGIYEIPLRFTMRGDWILLVTGELADGRRISHQIDVDVTGPSG